MSKYNVGMVFENGPFRCKIRMVAPGGNYLADCHTQNSHPQVMRFDEETIDDLVSASNRETDMSYGGGKRKKSRRRRTIRNESLTSFHLNPLNGDFVQHILVL